VEEEDQRHAPETDPSKTTVEDVPGKADKVSVLGKRAEQEDLIKDDDQNKQIKKKKEVGTNLTITEKFDDPGSEGETEATGPGAVGNLTGVSVGACQEP
jgi:hypothetical protein